RVRGRGTPGPASCAEQVQGDAMMADTSRASKHSNAKQSGKLKRKAYEKQLAKPHVELVKLQEWVKHKGLKVCVVFEGRDGGGKGGTIKAITDRVSPRVFRVI